MLKPEYLRDLPDELVELYSEAELRILADMARRIHTYDYWIPAVEHQKRQLALAGRTHDEILSALQSLTGKAQQELKKLMQQAASETLRTDAAVYQAAGLAVPTVKDSEPLKRLLNIGYKELTGEFKNICRTTAKTAARQLEHALDVAWLEVQSGAIDANTSIRNVVQELADNGLQAIKYQSGRTDSLEVAVRCAVVTGVNQTCGKMQEELADEIGCDLMELTAHAGARPEHAVWQGKIVSRSGQPGYLSLSDIGYGSPGGFKGVNCRHDWGPYIEGSPLTWTDEELAKLNEPKYDYNGKKLTRYEVEQQQRANERRIRKYKREFAVLDATGQDTGEVSMRLKNAQAKQRDFLKQTGLKRQYDREQITFATPNVKNKLTMDSISGILKNHQKQTIAGRNGDSTLRTVGKIDIQKYSCVTPNIRTDEVIITDERIEHIKERHPSDYERFCSYFPEIIADPDYIIEANKPNTAVVLKKVKNADEHFQLVLRLAINDDPDGYKNSIITFLKIEEKRYQRYVRTKKVLYKRE